ncbi:MAG: 2-amino-4-hydroxy-6-hydroxymethyldihydropteridine diphosphokinase [Muribaculaceae bacterium]|nr:2-amino-4-hydroxy-6-hydroxymethyldihydropteridine diphosphokinase [Muribaculaceae bacterium]
MTKALLSLGANTPDKKERLALTIDAIAQIARIEAQTPIYETPAEGSIATKPYANALVVIETHAKYDELRATFKQWEIDAGRTPESKAQGIIPLDVDIITWNDKVIKERDMEFNYMKKGLELLGKI